MIQIREYEVKELALEIFTFLKQMDRQELGRILEPEEKVELLSIEECANRLKISTSTIRRWIKKKNLQRYKISRRIFLNFEQIKKCMKEG